MFLTGISQLKCDVRRGNVNKAGSWATHSKPEKEFEAALAAVMADAALEDDSKGAESSIMDGIARDRMKQGISLEGPSEIRSTAEVSRPAAVNIILPKDTEGLDPSKADMSSHPKTASTEGRCPGGRPHGR